jgi:hypothetical protein
MASPTIWCARPRSAWCRRHGAPACTPSWPGRWPRGAQSDPARVAEHWWAAARWREAALALREAAQRTRQAGRLETCEALLQRAADAHDRSGDAEARFAALADAAAAAMLRLSASDAAARLQDLAPLARHPDEKARLALLQAEAAFNAAEFPLALRRSASALALASPGSAVALDAEILHGHALAIGGRTDEGVQRLQHAVESAAANGLSDKEAAAWAGLAYALHAGARTGDAVLAQQRAVALARRRSNRSELAHALANLASVAHSAGDAPLALAQAVEADALFQAIGAAGVHTTWNSVTVARNAPATGRFDLALQALRLLHEGAAAAGPMAVAYVRMAHATTWSWLGRPAEALAALPPDGPEAGAAVHARVAACRAKLRRLQGEPAASPDAAAREALRHALGSAREEAALLCEWASLLPAAEAVERLGRARSQRPGPAARAGTARSLAAVRAGVPARTSTRPRPARSPQRCASSCPSACTASATRRRPGGPWPGRCATTTRPRPKPAGSKHCAGSMRR